MDGCTVGAGSAIAVAELEELALNGDGIASRHSAAMIIGIGEERRAKGPEIADQHVIGHGGRGLRGAAKARANDGRSHPENGEDDKELEDRESAALLSRRLRARGLRGCLDVGRWVHGMVNLSGSAESSARR